MVIRTEIGDDHNRQFGYYRIYLAMQHTARRKKQ